MKTSENTKNINLALFKFQGIMPKIKRNAKNSHFKSTYITWDDLADAVITCLQECGLYFEQEEGEVDGYVTVSTRITHAESGEYKQYAPYRIKEAATGNQDHNAGKSTTYAQKRSLVLALGIRGTDEDTDGNDVDPPKKQVTAQPEYQLKQDRSGKFSYQPAKETREVPPLPDAWNKIAEENIRSVKEMCLERKRFFAICNKKKLTDKQMKAICFLHTGELSRKNVTPEQFREINHNIQDATQEELYHMVMQALQQFRRGAVVGE